MGDGETTTETESPDTSAAKSGGLKIQQRNTDKASDAGVETRKEVAPWEREDAPKGSTESSLLAKDENGKDIVSGPTHYTHLANGRVVGTYGIGTHYTDADDNDGRPVPVVAHYAG
jgi:hypothetical protein